MKKSLSFLLVLVAINAIFAFGKNKVQYKNFEWYYIQSSHFDIYYYDSTLNLAKFTAQVAESAYVNISKDFNYKLKNRLAILVYKSHNDFQQTNVILEYMEEGIGGVTELFKNRIVLPFEGDYEQFRHVIHHELVHGIMNDMLYGGNVQSLITGRVTQVPVWVSEGMAEFQSEGWNNRLDMSVRDAVVNNYMPPLKYLGYYLPYQGGASVFRFIAETYGREKIAEFMHRLKGSINFEGVIRATFGMKLDDFSEQWHRWLKKMYWVDYANRQIPEEFSEKITDHIKNRNYLNVSPAISPDGAYIAFLSDKDGYQSLYLYSTVKGKIVKKIISGTRSESFEEMHFLRPGISFSPDSKKIAFTAKSKGQDWIYIKDIKKGKLEKIKIDLDGVYTVNWSPTGRYIAFVGNHNETSDIYVYDLKKKIVTNLTNDVFSDDMPSWAPDESKIVFVSNRQDYLDRQHDFKNFDMYSYNYTQKDIYEVTMQTREIKRITNTPWKENFPIYFKDSHHLMYTSDKNGINNLYYHDLRRDRTRVLTDVVNGIFQLSITRDFSKLVFVSYAYGGFDIFSLTSPLKLKTDEPKPTFFVNNMDVFKKNVLEFYKQNQEKPEGEKETNAIKDVTMRKDYSHFEFTPDLFETYNEQSKKQKRKNKTLELPKEKTQTANGDYYVRKYKINLSPDFVMGQAGYNTFFGVQGYTQFSFSDLMGDYRILLNTNLVYDLRNSDYALTFINMKHRIDYGLSAFHFADYFFRNPEGLIRFRNYGLNAFATYGLSRYRRIDFSMIWYNVALEYLDIKQDAELANTVLPQVQYVFDNVIYGFTGPVAGTRYFLSFLFSPPYGKNSRDFKSIIGDYRRYFMLNRNYQFATRFSGGVSFGRNAQQYFLGGVDNWINRQFKNGEIKIDRLDDIYFSSFITPLRGANYYEAIGDRFLLTNLEFRFPLINLLSLGFPPITLGNIRGVMFADLGTAWYDGDRLQLFDHDEFGNLMSKDLIMGYGAGARVYFLGFLMRFDVAWRYRINRTSKPIFYFSLGGDI